MWNNGCLKNKICKVCGKEYKPKSAVQKYCFECKPVMDAKRKKEWYESHFPNRKKREKHYCKACGKPACATYDGEYYCNKHWLRLYTNGTLELQGKKRKTTYVIDGDYVYGTTSRGYVFKFDKSMYDKVTKHSWCRCGSGGYLTATINQKQVRLHRFILGLEGNKPSVDHINGDVTDNTIANLRICTTKQNGKNIKRKSNNNSGQAGVSQVKNGKWRSRIYVNGKEIRIGTYDTFEQAKRARLAAEKKYYKDFAPSLCRDS